MASTPLESTVGFVSVAYGVPLLNVRNGPDEWHAIEIGMYEVTFAEIAEAGLPSHDAHATECSSCAAARVTQEEAARYADYLSEIYGFETCYGEESGPEAVQTGSIVECEGFRLPTDTEWLATYVWLGYPVNVPLEVSEGPGPRGLTTKCLRSAWADEVAHYCGSVSSLVTQPVGSKWDRQHRVSDFLGNVTEWTSDDAMGRRRAGTSWFSEFKADRQKYPSKTVRGGMVADGAGQLGPLATANAVAYQPTFGVGVRLVRTLPLVSPRCFEGSQCPVERFRLPDALVPLADRTLGLAERRKLAERMGIAPVFLNQP